MIGGKLPLNFSAFSPSAEAASPVLHILHWWKEWVFLIILWSCVCSRNFALFCRINSRLLSSSSRSKWFGCSYCIPIKALTSGLTKIKQGLLPWRNSPSRNRGRRAENHDKTRSSSGRGRRWRPSRVCARFSFGCSGVKWGHFLPKRPNKDLSCQTKDLAVYSVNKGQLENDKHKHAFGNFFPSQMLKSTIFIFHFVKIFNVLFIKSSI